MTKFKANFTDCDVTNFCVEDLNLGENVTGWNKKKIYAYIFFYNKVLADVSTENLPIMCAESFCSYVSIHNKTMNSKIEIHENSPMLMSFFFSVSHL